MTTHHHTAHRHDHGHNHGENGAAEVAMAKLLELDAQVMQGYLRELTGWIADMTYRTPQQILDVGSGPGTGTLVLADQFPDARITAADSSARMLHRLETQAAARGISDRVRTVVTDLDEQWPKQAPDQGYDLVWAASFMHHLANPDHGFSQAFDSLQPDGLLAVTEMDFFPLVLPRDTSDAGLESRLHAAANTQPDHEWGGHIERAGFELVASRPFQVEVDEAQAGNVLNQYAQLSLTTLRAHAQDSLPAADLAALDTLLDARHPQSVAHRTDLTLRTTRTTWLARRTA